MTDALCCFIFSFMDFPSRMFYEHTAKIGISRPPGKACRNRLIYRGKELWSILMSPSLLC